MAAVLLLAGCVGLAMLGVATPLWLAVVVLLLFGLGLGAVMQFSLLIAQMASPRRDVGAATAMSQFFRAMGMSLGTAALGGVFSMALTAAVTTHGSVVNFTPGEFLAAPSAVQAEIIVAYSGATHVVFLCTVLVGVVAVASSVMLPVRLPPAPRAKPSTPTLDG